jgi:ferritin
MKTIAELTGGDFLRHCNKIRHQVSDIIKETGVLEIRKRQPEYSGKETEAEKAEMRKAQAKKNIDSMLDCMLEEHAEQTMKLLNLFVIREEGDPEEIPDFDLIAIGLDLIGNQKVMNFFISAASSGLKFTQI